MEDLWNGLIKMIEIPAIKFYDGIKEKSAYRLVNGLFIVRYINKEEWFYVGDFLKCNSPINNRKINLVRIPQKIHPQRFNKKLNQTTTGNGFWQKLNIKFTEKPIINILQ